MWELENRPRIGPRPIGPVAKLQPSPEGLGDGSPRLWSAGGAALPTFGVPRLRRSDDVAEPMSQPSRAGLKFGYRPYGPGSDSRSIFEFPHRLSRPGLLSAVPPGLSFAAPVQVPLPVLFVWVLKRQKGCRYKFVRTPLVHRRCIAARDGSRGAQRWFQFPLPAVE